MARDYTERPLRSAIMTADNLRGERAINRFMVTTMQTLPGYAIAKNLGVVRGLTVRSRSIVGNIVGGIQSLFGGNISIYSDLCEQAREEAFESMCEHADKLHANAIISVRYDATEIMAGLTEVLCYGSAVVAEAAGGVGKTAL